MTDQEIFEKIKQVLEKWFEVDPESIDLQSSVRDDIELDSLDTVDFVVALEKEFGFKIVRSQDEPAMRKFRSLADVVDFVKYKKGLN